MHRTMEDETLGPPDRPTLSSVVAPKSTIVVATVPGPEDAASLASALQDSPIGALEITLRTPNAIAAIERIAPGSDIPIGAGTVTDAAQARAAHEAGSAFLVSPGFDPALARVCRDLPIPYLPGVATPSEVMLATRAGFRELKLFPVEQFGGVRLVKALGAAFPGVAFVPTGGVDGESAGRYLAQPNVLAVAGSWVAPSDLIEAANWEEIARRARKTKATGRDG